MQRIHAPFDEPTLAQIDLEVKKSGVSRAQWLSSAIGAYLRLLELSKGADPAEMAQDVAQLALPIAYKMTTMAYRKRFNNSGYLKKKHVKTQRNLGAN